MSREHTILEAAKACYLRLGVAKTGVADIATESGISRATIYRCFSSVEDIFMAVLARESQDMVIDFQQRIADLGNPQERIVEGMLFCLDEVPRRPLHAHFFQSESKAWVAGQAMPAETLHRMCVDTLRESLGLRKASAAFDSSALDHLAELILRLLVSYVMAPSHRARNNDEMREFLHSVLDPVIRDILGSSKTSKPAIKSTRSQR